MLPFYFVIGGSLKRLWDSVTRSADENDEDLSGFTLHNSCEVEMKRNCLDRTYICLEFLGGKTSMFVFLLAHFYQYSSQEKMNKK